MRRAVILLYSILCMIICMSCKKNTPIEQYSTENDYFVYPMENVTAGFDVDETGTLYYIASEEMESKDGTPDLHKHSGDIIRKLYKVDPYGDITESYILGDKPANGLTIRDGRAYYYTVLSADTVSGGANKSIESSVCIFYEYTMDSGEEKELYRLEGFDFINKFDVINNCIYFIGIDKDQMNKEYTLAGDMDYYYYSGEVLCVIDYMEGKVSELPVDFPVGFAGTKDDNVLIYAHDGEGGYYFSEYNVEDCSFSEKIYYDIGRIDTFDIYNKDNDIMFLSTDTSVTSLSAASFKSDKGIVELIPDIRLNGIVCRGEYTYYVNNRNSYKIERVRSTSYIRDNHVIRMVSAEHAPYTPFGCGYTFDREYPDAESFALSVLSLEDSYDLYLMSSRQNISENIRNKGSFYPLNEIDGVKEYLDACFPYIKEAAMTKEGDIWMFPVSIDIPCLLYNEDLCTEKGIDLTVPVEWEELINFLNVIQTDKSLNNSYDVSLYILTENVFHQYLRSYKDFGTELFSDITSLLKTKANYTEGESVLGNPPNVWEMLRKGDTDNFLMSLAYYYERQAIYASTNDIRLSGLPYVTEEKANVATCLYMAVNPYSKNLNSTLGYIRSLCDYMLNHSKGMLFQDRSLYPAGQAFDDLYNIYSNGEVVFTYPDGLFMENFYRYLQDEISQEAFIGEANRKLHAFIRE